MRMMFGILGLLGTLIAIVLIWGFVELPYDKAVIDSGRKATQQAEMIAGRDPSGRPALDSIVMSPVRSGYHIVGMVVTNLDPQGAIAQYYGLQINDTILSVNGLNLGELAQDDEGLCKAQVLDAYRASWPISVRRAGQEVTLPAASTPLSPNIKSSIAPPPQPTPTASTTQPSARQRAPVPGSVQDQARRLLQTPPPEP